MKNTVLISLFLILILSCKKKDSCKEEVMATKQFETEFGCFDTRHTLNIGLTNDLVLIQSKDVYDATVTGPCHPIIDFNTYDLVIGKQSVSNLNDTIIYDLRNVCPDNALTLTIDIIQSAVTQPDNVTYHTIIPKVADGKTIYINLNVR
jgi:hypothetical protein